MAAPAMITTLDDFEAEYRNGIGYVMPPRGSREASLDNIQRFGDGVGDYNPLYRDEAYGAQSRFGTVIAPPIFIYGASLGIALAINGNIDGRRLSSSYFPMNYAGRHDRVQEGPSGRATASPPPRRSSTSTASTATGSATSCSARPASSTTISARNWWPPRRRSWRATRTSAADEPFNTTARRRPR